MQHLPEEIIDIQKWFGLHLQQPLGKLINGFPEYDAQVKQSCATYCKEGPYLKAHERMGIYHRLYWYRLLNLLHNSFAFVMRLFGQEAFAKQLLEPYLIQNPSSHWSLKSVSARFLNYLNQEYHAADRTLVLAAASLDFAYEQAFLAPEFASLQAIGLENITVQPHLFLFAFHYDFFGLREEFLKKSSEEWMREDFPKAHKYATLKHFVLYRSNMEIVYEEITELHYLLLQELKLGRTLEELCCFLDTLQNKIVIAEKEVEDCFFLWSARGWLTRGLDASQTAR